MNSKVLLFPLFTPQELPKIVLVHEEFYEFVGYSFVNPSANKHVSIVKFIKQNPAILRCNILGISQCANEYQFLDEYEYEYYSLIQNSMNTNTNIIR